MAITFIYNDELGIVEIVVKGMVSYNELISVQAPVFELAQENNTDMFLLDLTNFERSLSSVDILVSVSSYNDNTDKRIRIAVIVPVSQESKQDAYFYETVCANRGWNAQLFPERQGAISWLVHRQSD